MEFWDLLRLRDESRENRLPPQALYEPILAYRAWRIGVSKLLSCLCDCYWKPRERMDASCNRNGIHAYVPAWECRCGFYAYKSEAALAASDYTDMGNDPTVCGRVALWGRVIDHDLGYRAQHAYPQVLYLRGDQRDDLIRRIADCYAIECLPPRSFAS